MASVRRLVDQRQDGGVESWSLRTYQRLAYGHPTVAVFQNQLGGAFLNIGNLDYSHRRWPEAQFR